MNPERRSIRIGLAAMLSVMVVAAVVLTVHDDFSESASALLEPAFTDLRIKLPPLPPLTEQQFKSLPPVSTMIYVPPTKTEVKNALARHGVQMHVFKNVRLVMIHKLESISAKRVYCRRSPVFESNRALISMQLTLAQAHIPDMMAHGGVVTKKQVSICSDMIVHNCLFFSAIVDGNAGRGCSKAEGNGSG